jgi:hypothetical protein
VAGERTGKRKWAGKRRGRGGETRTDDCLLFENEAIQSDCEGVSSDDELPYDSVDFAFCGLLENGDFHKDADLVDGKEETETERDAGRKEFLRVSDHYLFERLSLYPLTLYAPDALPAFHSGREQRHPRYKSNHQKSFQGAFKVRTHGITRAMWKLEGGSK